MSNPTAAEIVTSEARKWLELEDDLLPVVPLVVAVANRLPGPPVWAMIVAPPSSGKSDVIMGVASINGVHAISTVTAHTFASGMRAADGETPSLLDRLKDQGKWLLVVKDFGTLLSLPPLQRNPVFGQLREIFDGKYDAGFGTGVDFKWQGKLGLLVGATPQVDREQKLGGELGERFVQFRPSVPNPNKVAMKALLNAERETERHAALARAYRQGEAKALQGWKDLKRQRRDYLVPEAYPTVAALGEFVANARRPVRRERSSYDTTYEVAPPEGPARLIKTFEQIHRAALLVYGGDVKAANRLVIRIATDTMPGKRGRLLRELAKRSDGVTIEVMAAALQCDRNTARRELENLEQIGFARHEKPVGTLVYEASDLLSDAASRVFLDEFEPSEALAKLFDVPNNSLSERKGERERVEV